MDYRTSCCAIAKRLVQKPSWDFLLKQRLIRNVQWNYQEGMSISALCSLPRFSRKSQLSFCTRFSTSAAIGSIVHHLFKYSTCIRRPLHPQHRRRWLRSFASCNQNLTKANSCHKWRVGSEARRDNHLIGWTQNCCKAKEPYWKPNWDFLFKQERNKVVQSTYPPGKRILNLFFALASIESLRGFQ